MRNAWIGALLVASLGCAEPKSEAPAGSGPPGQPLVVAPAGGPVQARSFRFTPRPRTTEIAEGAPLSLTASDGTGLALVSLRADAVMEGPLAFTQVHMVFQNPEDRVIEGHFRVTLPGGASVSRFAMKIEERWQEGEVVELQAARRAYEDFLHRRQDPALLEQAPGNEFSARVFPIPARGQKELVLSYSQALTSADEPYRIPLRGLPQLGQLSIRVFAGGSLVAEQDQRDVVPVEDFRAPVPAAASAVRSGELVALRVTPSIDDAPDEIDSLLVLVDTSASRALGFAEQARTVQALIAGLAEGAGDRPILVAAFDQEIETIYEGGAKGYSAAHNEKLLARAPLGASDLGAALRWAGQARPVGAAYKRVVLVSDGVATAGDLDGDPLRKAAAGLRAAGIERLDAVVLGGIRDEDRLASLVTAGLARDGAVIDAGNGPEAIAQRLTRRSKSGIAVTVEGADWWWPRQLDAIQAGDQAMVYARVPASRPLRVTLDGAAVDVADKSIVRSERPLVERAVAQAEIASLSAELDTLDPADRKRRTQLKENIVRISTARRVLSPYTALLVLETADDYVRFGIDRKALTDILTVASGQLAMIQRTEKTLVIAAPETRVTRSPENKKDKAKGQREETETKIALDQNEADQRQTADYSRADGKEEEKSVEQLAEGRGGVAADPGHAPPATTSVADGPGVRSAPETGAVAQAGAAQGANRAAPPPRTPDMAPSPEPAPVEERPSPRPARRTMSDRESPADDAEHDDDIPRPRVDPYTGQFRDVMKLVRKKKLDDALAKATAWRAESPGDVMALVALGEVLEARSDLARAARAYGSLIDLFPQRADLRRFAGQRLDRIAQPGALALAADTYARAAEQRSDHPASHRLLAFALVRQGHHERAFAALENGLAQDYPEGRFAGTHRILSEDLGLVAAAWTKAEPARRGEIRKRLTKAGGTAENSPSIRFVLHWETDANDVDFHIRDAAGNHAFYSQPTLASGGELYADVTTGYGPECFTIRGPRSKRAAPYKLEAHYYSRGPMGYGMGKLQVIEHDGTGGLRFEDRPFQIMQDNAFVDLGVVRR